MIRRTFSVNLILFLFSLSLALLAAEWAFRWMLFGDSKAFEFLRDPSRYGTVIDEEWSPIFTDDYWKLYYLFGGEHKPPNKPHPLLGSVGAFNRKTLAHFESEKVGKRSPVLWYGDSFSQCAPGVTCFQDILNSDTLFSAGHYLLNYGVGGYSVGQISLLLRATVKLYDRPFVVFGFMTRDLERSVLSVRTGQQPCFSMQNGKLVMTNVPIDSIPSRYFGENKPQISSYLYRRFISSDLNILGRNKRVRDDYVQNITAVNKELILSTVNYLEEAGVDYAVLVFNPLHNHEGDWRNLFIREFLHDHNIPYIYSLDLIEQDTAYHEIANNYTVDDGHPNERYNRLVSEEIKRCVLDTGYLDELARKNHAKFSKDKPLYDPSSPEFIERQIRRDSVWMEDIRRKAEREKVSVDEMVKRDAEWTSAQKK